MAADEKISKGLITIGVATEFFASILVAADYAAIGLTVGAVAAVAVIAGYLMW